MTNTPPTDPNSRGGSSLDFEEFMGVLVAFATIGAILFWSFSRKSSGWNFSDLLSLSPAPISAVKPNPNPNPLVDSGKLPLVLPSTPSTNLELDQIKPTNQSLPEVIPPPLVPVIPIVVEPPLAPAVPSTTKSPSTSFQVASPVAKMPVTPPAKGFTDLPPNFWGQKFIDALSSRNIIKGFEDYSFRPNQPITRAEFAAILQRAFNQKLGSNQLAFTDVPGGYWATKDISESIGSGFLKGYPDKTFKPDQKITRVQVLVSLVSGLKLKGSSTIPADKTVGIFKDAKDIPKYATDKVAIASLNNMVVNYPDVQAFAPNREATRAEVAAMVHQALVKMGRIQPVNSPNIVKVPQ
jgi:S-layer homology domain